MTPRKIVPLILRPRRFFRLLFDPKAPKLARAIGAAALLYAIWPIDLLPDVAPFIGYLDDLGVLAAAMAYLLRTLEHYDRSLPSGAPAIEPKNG